MYSVFKIVLECITSPVIVVDFLGDMILSKIGGQHMTMSNAYFWRDTTKCELWRDPSVAIRFLLLFGCARELIVPSALRSTSLTHSQIDPAL